MWKMDFPREKEMKNLKVKRKHRKTKKMKTMAGHSSNLCTGLISNRGNITPDSDE